MPPASTDPRSASKSAPTLAFCIPAAATTVTPKGPGPSSAAASEDEVTADTRSTTTAYTGPLNRLPTREAATTHCPPSLRAPGNHFHRTVAPRSPPPLRPHHPQPLPLTRAGPVTDTPRRPSQT